MESIEGQIFELSQNENRTGLTHIKDTLKEVIEILDERSKTKGFVTGVPTGFADLDRILLGMQKKDLILLAARPSVGKTALAVNIALNAALKDYKVAIFSLEMSKSQLAQRMLSSLSLVNSKQFMSGDITEWEDIFEASSIIAGKSIYMDDTAGISITELRSKCRRLKADSGLDFIMIDYLQLMTSEGRNENRQQEISTISRNLKALAKELDVPILALSQLSRDSEKNKRKPKLSDLRESGAIEQDADVVILLHREDYQNEEAEIQNQIELIIAKHRNGEIGSIRLNFIKEYSRFMDLQTERDKELFNG